MLDAFQVMDRMVIEISMRLYNIPQHQRMIVRGDNQKLHRAVRQGSSRARRTQLPTIR
jgi:hypothetical protein